jgi:hypothetical protein
VIDGACSKEIPLYDTNDKIMRRNHSQHKRVNDRRLNEIASACLSAESAIELIHALDLERELCHYGIVLRNVGLNRA